MHKPQSISFNCFAARLTEINNYLPLFPESSESKKMDSEELNEILLQCVPNGWAKKPIYKDGNSKGGPTRRPARCSSGWKFLNKSTKEEHLLKPPQGKINTVWLLVGNER